MNSTVIGAAYTVVGTDEIRRSWPPFATNSVATELFAQALDQRWCQGRSSEAKGTPSLGIEQTLQMVHPQLLALNDFSFHRVFVGCESCQKS